MLRKVPTRIPQRLPKGKGMSVGLATICTDGLVICADTLISMDTFKYYRPKLSRVQYAITSKSVVLAYSGSLDKNNVIVSQFENELGRIRDKSAQEIGDSFQAVLNGVFPGKAKENHQMLCGFADAKTLFLLKSRDREVSPVQVWDCIGYGDSSLIQYLATIFLEDRIHLPIRLAVPICDYIIAQAKKYVQWCGGDTNLFVLTPDSKFHEQIPSSEIDALCGRIERGINSMLTSASMLDLDERECLEVVKGLRGLIEEASSKFMSFCPPLPVTV